MSTPRTGRTRSTGHSAAGGTGGFGLAGGLIASQLSNSPFAYMGGSIAAEALREWLSSAEISNGAIFRRLWKATVGPALSPAAVGEIVRKRARLASLDGDWAGHSLRAGFVTEAGRRNIPIGDVMAMTEHRKVDTVLGYYRSGELGANVVSDLLE